MPSLDSKWESSFESSSSLLSSMTNVGSVCLPNSPPARLLAPEVFVVSDKKVLSFLQVQLPNKPYSVTSCQIQFLTSYLVKMLGWVEWQRSNRSEILQLSCLWLLLSSLKPQIRPKPQKRLQLCANSTVPIVLLP